MRRSTRHFSSALLVSVVVLAGGDPGQSARAGVFGDDDRHEVHQSEAPWQTLATESVVAMMRVEHVDLCDGVSLRADVPLAREWHSMCEGVAFAEQPIVAACSGVLIEPDLVLTASHCMSDDECAETVFARGPRYLEDGSLELPSGDQVAACKSVLARPDGADVAILQLERPIGTEVAEIAPAPPAIDDPIAIIGFPSYVPMKVTTPCTARDRVGNSTMHDCDVFRGNSGSATFDAEGRVFAVLSQASGDYRPRDGEDCSEVQVYAQDGTLPGVTDIPQFARSSEIGSAIAELCDGGWPGPSCGRSAECGDGVCSGGEDSASCLDDCVAPSCGDGVCSVADEAVSCRDDCEFLGCFGGEDGDAGPTDAGPGEPDSGIEPGDDDDSGCGCQGAGDGGGAGLALLAIGLVLARRRRLA